MYYVLNLRLRAQRQRERDLNNLIERVLGEPKKRDMPSKKELEARIGYHLGKVEELRNQLNDYEFEMPTPAEEIPADGTTYYLLIGDDKDVIVPIIAGKNPKFDEQVLRDKCIFFETKEDAKKYLCLL